MKTEHLLFLSIVSGLAHASPARNDCGVVKRFAAVDLCGVTYGGTWSECASGPTANPTFSMPPCSISASEIPVVTAPPTAEAAGSSNGTGCGIQNVCVDAGKMCGEGMRRFGGCYDVCKPESGVLTAPSCKTELPLMPTATARVLGNVTTPKGPDRKQNPQCNEPGKSFLCAPADWS